ncbi:MAG: hypothetical protein C4543_09805 [Ignavibacteriales bacterium]|jgi:DUF4097 and DUF4098 domain-containing protein YvlB|nr:MAG: hypothetical protein C4543_09805 [Ignavibacteriales bacterium]
MKLFIRNLTIFLFVLLLSSVSFSQSLRTIHEKSFDVNSGELLEIQSDVGDIKIKTWDENTVHIKVFGNRKAEEDVDFHFEKTSKGVLIDADKDGSWNWFSGVKVKYEINVPKTFNLDLRTGGGDVIVLDLIGEIIAKTSGGDIDFENINGEISATTSGGDVKIVKAVGSVRSSTSGGDIDIKSKDGKVSASTSGGDVTLEYYGENFGIDLGTSGGDITVLIPDNLKADLNLKTSGGDIECDLEARVKEVTRSKFIGIMNGGGTDLSCRTSGGDITVRTF